MHKSRPVTDAGKSMSQHSIALNRAGRPTQNALWEEERARTCRWGHDGSRVGSSSSGSSPTAPPPPPRSSPQQIPRQTPPTAAHNHAVPLKTRSATREVERAAEHGGSCRQRRGVEGHHRGKRWKGGGHGVAGTWGGSGRKRLTATWSMREGRTKGELVKPCTVIRCHPLPSSSPSHPPSTPPHPSKFSLVSEVVARGRTMFRRGCQTASGKTGRPVCEMNSTISCRKRPFSSRSASACWKEGREGRGRERGREKRCGGYAMDREMLAKNQPGRLW